MSEYRITGLELRKIGVFEKLKLNFPERKIDGKAEIHIFTGINGTGKTTLLQALTYFDIVHNSSYYAKKYEDSPKGSRFDGLSQKITSSSVDIDKEESSLKISFSGKFDWLWDFSKKSRNFIERTKFGSIGRFSTMGNKKELGALYSEQLTQYYKASNYETPNYSFFLYTGQRQILDTEAEVFTNFKSPALMDALDFNRTGLNGNLFKWIANTKTKAALAFQTGNKNRSNQYLENINSVERALSEVIDRKIEFIIDEKTLQVQVNIDDKAIKFNQLAEGYKSVINWLVDLFFRLDAIHFSNGQAFTLFLDEIDVHLHPAAQRKILPVIQKLFPKAQIFLTTHSPFVIGSVDDALVYKFKFDKRGNSVLDGDPMPSEDGMSYNYIVKEILGVKEDFGIEVEKTLKVFYEERDKLMGKPKSSANKLLKISKELSVQSPQLQSIVGSELRQLSRHINREFTI